MLRNLALLKSGKYATVIGAKRLNAVRSVQCAERLVAARLSYRIEVELVYFMASSDKMQCPDYLSIAASHHQSLTSNINTQINKILQHGAIIITMCSVLNVYHCELEH